jgi:hypothetical protein
LLAAIFSEQVTTRKNADLNRRRGHGADAAHKWAKRAK